MAGINIAQAHPLLQNGAMYATRKVVQQAEFDMVIAQEDDVLSFTRTGLAGTVAVQESHVQLDITLGFMFKEFTPMIEEKAGRNLQKIFCGPIAAGKCMRFPF